MASSPRSAKDISDLSREGVVRDANTGDLYIPATRRPDGSIRKARRVKDGYVPQDEMPVYETKGAHWVKSKPACPGLHTETSKEAKDSQSISKSAKKNAKRKEKKKLENPEPDPIDNIPVMNVTNKVSKLTMNDTPESEHEKKLKNLRKKLKQIECLEAKINSGDIENPEKDQLDKVARKEQIKNEIEDLELEPGL